MRTFRVGGVIVGCEWPLPELTELPARTPDWVLLVDKPRPPGSFPPPFHDDLRADGQAWLSMARQDSGYALRFWDLADFEVDVGARVVRCVPAPGIPPETVRHLFLDQVVPALLTLDGRLVLHASAVVVDGGAIAFVGMSGSGKSTLASAFAVAGRAVLTDDCLVLRERETGMAVIPMYPGLRLWPDSLTHLEVDQSSPQVAHYGPKRRFVPAGSDATEVGEVPLTGLLLLEQDHALDQAVAIEALSPRQAFIDVFRTALRLDPDAVQNETEFHAINRLVESVPIGRLRYRPDFGALPHVRATVLEWLAAQREETAE